MPATATLRLGGRGTNLVVKGFCKAEQLQGRQVLSISALWQEEDLGIKSIRECPGEFEIRFPLPKTRLQNGTVRLRVSPTIQLGTDQRELGLAVSSVGLN